MPKQQFAIDPGGPKRLAVEWKGIFKETTVSVDGKTLGTFQTKQDLTSGGTFRLDDGRELGVRLQQSLLAGAAVHLTVDGKPIAGSGGDPNARLKGVAGLIFFIGGLTILLSLIAELGKVELLQAYGFGWISLAIGVVFIGLGFGVLKGSLAALIAAVVLYGADIILTIVAMADAGGRPGGVFIKVAFFIVMCQGFGAMKDLRKSGG
jgi:hypothetical protein